MIQPLLDRLSLQDLRVINKRWRDTAARNADELDELGESILMLVPIPGKPGGARREASIEAKP